MVTVSICIPTYNNLDFFKRCFNSVLEQDFSDYEIIISDDSTNSLIDNYCRTLTLKNVFYTHNTIPLGSPENWNNALRKANGKYIKILHHDDYFTDKTSLGKYIAAFDKSPQISFVFSYSKIYFKNDNSIYIHKQTNTQLKRIKKNIEFLFFRNIIGAPSAVCFKNDKNIFFSPQYKWLVDIEFYISYLKKNSNFLLIHEPLITIVAGEKGQITIDVTKDAKLVVSENINLYAGIHSSIYNEKKSTLYFEELFDQHNIKSFLQLNSEFNIPLNLQPFMENIFIQKSKFVFFKRLRKKLLTSRYNKRIFKIERF